MSSVITSRSEFQYDLGILSVERRLQCHLVRPVFFTYLADFIENPVQFGIRILLLAHVDNTHFHVRGLLALSTNNPEAKYIGSGVNSNYGCHP